MLFSFNAPVGHSFTQAPQDTQFDAAKPAVSPGKGRAPATGRASKAFSIMVSAKVG